MLELLTVSLYEIKSYVVVLPFDIKMVKRITLLACSLKHNLKFKLPFLPPPPTLKTVFLAKTSSKLLSITSDPKNFKIFLIIDITKDLGFRSNENAKFLPFHLLLFIFESAFFTFKFYSLKGH